MRVAPVCAVALTLAGCGGDDNDEQNAQATRAAATSLQEAMDSSSRAIDGVSPTRTSLSRLASTLETAEAQTSDVISLLGPKASDPSTPEARLLGAAREQRTFLQAAADVAGGRTRSEVNTAATTARSQGESAASAFAALRASDPDLAGLLPAGTTFNVGRLIDAARGSTKPKATSGSSSSSNGSSDSSASDRATGGSTSCGDGISVNGSTTSCAFGRNVADAYAASGGEDVIDVYSPTTGESYTMRCSGALPTICRGGNNAVVYLR